MKRSIWWLIFFAAFVVAAFGAVAGLRALNDYLAYYHSKPPVLPASLTNATSTVTDQGSSTPKSAFVSYLMRTSIALPVESGIDVTSWKMHENANLHYGIQYPPDALVTISASSTTFIFPPEGYFHWPLLDTVKVTVTVASTCPDSLQGQVMPLADYPKAFSLNGYQFARQASTDAAAGNVYTEIAYDTKANGQCYRVDFFDHGANGAGLYVGDQRLIRQYDATHDTDMASMLGIFSAMLSTFQVRTPTSGN